MRSKMNMVAKIGGGFGVVILLLIVIFILAWAGLHSLSKSFSAYRAMVSETNLQFEFEVNMERMHINVDDFIRENNDEAVRAFDGLYQKMYGILEAAAEQLKDNPERTQVVNTFKNNLSAYNNAFKKVQELERNRSKIMTETLDVLGPKLESDLSHVMLTSKEQFAIDSSYLAGLSLNHLLMGRIAASKFIFLSHPDHLAKAVKELSEVIRLNGDLERSSLSPDLEKMVMEVGIQVKEYLSAFNEMAETINERNRVITDELAVSGEKMKSDLIAVRKTVQNAQNEQGSSFESQTQNTTRLIVLVSIVTIIIAVFAAFFITRSITGPVRRVLSFVDTLAKGDFTASLPVNQHDEIGQMAKALHSTVSELGQMIKDIISGVNTLTSSSSGLSSIAIQLSENAGDSSVKANSVSTSAEEMSTNMNSIAAAMEQSTSNVSLVATAAEEMSATVGEIAQNAERAKTISAEAVQQSQTASRKMDALGHAATKIGKVTEAITEISEQTNLLALNATIEAARAGEAGKGFAVVANEIKALAKQTAEATVDIKHQIEEMQNTTDGTIADIERIGRVIEEINEVITTIATAVDEQSSATREIAENVSQASAGMSEVNQNVAHSTVAASDITKDIGEINLTSDNISKASNDVEKSAAELTELAGQLKDLVNRFKV